MRTIIAIASCAIVLVISGCSLFNQGAKQRELPPRQEEPRRVEDTIPSDVENVPDAVPRDEPLSQYGNPESYTVYGETYQVLPTARGYNEKGYASWYGRKFHGRRTSSGEIYDMYQMTAAHRTLPLPSFVRVRNIENNREIVVRVNDRGPFHSDRIIDLSYAAAAKLGILDAGSAMVTVEAIDANRSIASTPVQSPPSVPPPTPQPSYPTTPATPSYGGGSADGYQGPYANPAPSPQPPQAYPQGPSVSGGSIDLNVPDVTPVPIPAPAPPPVAVSPPSAPSGYGNAGSIYDEPPTEVTPSEPSSIYDTPASIYDTPTTSYDNPPADPYAAAPAADPYSAPPAPAYTPPQNTAYAPAPSAAITPGTYLQAGAYGQSTNAYAMAERLRNAGFRNVVIDSASGDGLSRVHLGPYNGGGNMDADKRRLNTLGIKAFTVRR